MIRGFALALTFAFPAEALTFSFPGQASETVRRDDGLTELALPDGAWNGETVPTRSVTGQAVRTAWQLRGGASTPAQILAMLDRQLRDAGWTIDFTCGDATCGGYDFRFASNTLPAPGMYVDLGDFRYLLASRADGAVLSLMVSRGRDRAWVQSTEVVPEGGAGPAPTRIATPSAPESSDIVGALERTGRAVLGDVRFASGSSALQSDADGPLSNLAAYLADNPRKTFVIVGHTDTDGGMDGNIALSTARAQAVRRALITSHGVPPAQIEARGVGFLAPAASNGTPEGRRSNRRVEIVATN